MNESRRGSKRGPYRGRRRGRWRNVPQDRQSHSVPGPFLPGSSVSWGQHEQYGHSNPWHTLPQQHQPMLYPVLPPHSYASVTAAGPTYPPANSNAHLFLRNHRRGDVPHFQQNDQLHPAPWQYPSLQYPHGPTHFHAAPPPGPPLSTDPPIFSRTRESQNRKDVQKRMTTNSNFERQPESNGKQWVSDLETSLEQEKSQTNIRGSNDSSSLLDRLCRTDDRLNVSAPFKLSSTSFDILESALLTLEEGHGGEAKSGRHPFCLSCLKSSIDTSRMDFSASPFGSSYTPWGYEELDGKSEEDDEETPIYIMEIQTVVSSNVGDAGVLLEDFAVVGDSTANSAAIPLSVTVVHSSRLVEIIAGNCRSYDDLRYALLSEDSLPFPQAVGAGCQSRSPSLACIVSKSEDPNQVPFQPSDTPTSISGALILKFALFVHPSGSLSRFLVGRRYRFIEKQNEGDDDELKELTSSKEFLRMALLNAEPFVPREKKMQWDAVPDAILWVRPRLPTQLEAIQWLWKPGERRSCYDLAAANVALHLTSNFFQYSECIFPRVMGERWWAEFNKERYCIIQNKSIVMSESRSDNRKAATTRHQSNPGGIEADANRIQHLCQKIYSNQSQKNRFNAMKYSVQMREAICGYVQRMLLALERERLRTFEDMKKHDRYSIRWKQIEIIPPSKGDPNCFDCGARDVPLRLCAYHAAFRHDESSVETRNEGMPVAIKTTEQLEMFPEWLGLLRPGHQLVARVVVPGVADNFPLVSVGDLVRFRFTAMGMSNEVIGEVADVALKNEVVSVFLPPPAFERNCSMAVFPYLQALLSTESRFVDAHVIIQTNLHATRVPSQEISDDDKQHIGRFDLRFGFLGGHGFDIARSVISATPSYSEGGPDLLHLCRILAPTHHNAEEFSLCQHGLKTEISDWGTPVNAAQRAAVTDIVNFSHGRAPYVIYGPAGTGKSMTVCEAVFQVLQATPEAKILVCAPSDAACDVLATRLLPRLTRSQGLLRINWWSRKLSSLSPSLLSCTCTNTSGNFVIPKREFIEGSSVVVCQCFVAGCLDMNERCEWMSSHFTHLFVDETSQAMECEALIPMLKVGIDCSIILAGDPRQLGPTVRDPVASELGLGISIQERLMKLPLYRYQKEDNRVMTKLVGNYRSHDALLTIPSNLFYDGSLQCLAPKEVSSPYVDWGGLGPARFPMLLFDVSMGKEKSKVDTPSFFNIEECKAVVSIIQGLLRSKKIEKAGGIGTGEICVITPFRAQVLMLRAKLRLAGLGSISVGVVEDFQGQETSIVLISTVLTQPHTRWSQDSGKGGAKLGFMHDPKRFNVAITRAQALCIVVGHARYLKSSGTYWTALMEHIENNDGVIGPEGDSRDSLGHEGKAEASDNVDPYGIRKLIQRVEELKLGSGHEEDKLDLFHYYEDIPQWRVMLS